MAPIQDLVPSRSQVNGLGMSEPGEEMFLVAADETGFAVSDQTGLVVVRCATEPNALNYAALLNEAYKRGYKAGYHDARKGRASA